MHLFLSGRGEWRVARTLPGTILLPLPAVLRLMHHNFALPLAIGGAGMLTIAACLEEPVSSRTLVLCPAAIVLGLTANHLWRPRKPTEPRGFDVV